ncbi:alpha/beta fold hydrolase [Actinoallomurus sp. CA-150999]|uniref:alpha/beta fold hydrolase n=1 Tax=Actinoallomurus sp. CA-150999 TaxID=3239887 RepID=UPI003D914302
MEWVERVVVRDGVRLRCLDSGGSGPPIVLLHGLAGHAGEWEAMARPLGSGHRVVTVDQRGHGRSERYPGDVSRAVYVEDVVAVIERLGLGTVVLIGQSLGGHTAMLTAAACPELVDALILVEAGAGGPNPAVPERIGEWLASWPVPFGSYEAAVDFFGGGPLGRGWADGLEERADGGWPRFDRDVMVASLADNARRSFWPEWERVRCPTMLVLAGSGLLPLDEAGEMIRRRPGTVAVSIPETGHDLHLERPERLYGVIASFLGDIDGPSMSHRSPMGTECSVNEN